MKGLRKHFNNELANDPTQLVGELMPGRLLRLGVLGGKLVDLNF